MSVECSLKQRCGLRLARLQPQHDTTITKTNNTHTNITRTTQHNPIQQNTQSPPHTHVQVEYDPDSLSFGIARVGREENRGRGDGQSQPPLHRRFRRQKSPNFSFLGQIQAIFPHSGQFLLLRLMFGSQLHAPQQKSPKFIGQIQAISPYFWTILT